MIESNNNNTTTTTTEQIDLDKLLETEKQQNKVDAWNKLDKTLKTQKLHMFAEKYGKDNSLPVKDIKSLKQFCL